MWQYPRAPANHRGPQATMLHSYHQAPFGPCDAFVAIIHSCLSKNRVPVSTRSNAVWCGLSSYSNLVKNWPEMSGNPLPSPSNIIQHRMAIVDPFSDGAHSDSPSARRVTARCAELPLSRFWLPPPKSFAQRVWNRWSLPGPRPGVPLWPLQERAVELCARVQRLVVNMECKHV